MHGRLKLGVVAALLLGRLALRLRRARPLEVPHDAPTETGNATPGTPGQPVPHKPSVLDPLIR
jgi:hypothetical protein